MTRKHWKPIATNTINPRNKFTGKATLLASDPAISPRSSNSPLPRSRGLGVMGVMVMAAGLKPSRHRKVKGRVTHIPRVGWGTLAARHYCHFTGRQIRLSLLSTATQSQSPTGRSRFSDRWDYADSSPALHDGAGGSFLGDWGSAATEPLFFSQAWELSASWKIGWASRAATPHPPVPPIAVLA